VNFDQGDTRDAYSEVDLEAEGLRNLVKEVIGTEYPGQNLEGETVNIIAPYAPLVGLAPILHRFNHLLSFVLGAQLGRPQECYKAR
jgi:hypothetical protein